MSNKTYLIISIVVILFAVIAGGVFFGGQKPVGSVACTEEAKLCPDGSAVGRTGPNCEFSACPKIDSLLSEAEARAIAEKTCIKGGEVLANGIYNKNSKTWWYDANLNSTRAGCNPACVVSEETKTAEINWRCTGAIPPEEKDSIFCREDQRNVDVCTTEYAPVCAMVEIQCIKAPCNPIQQTFGNPCDACRNSLVKSYVAGECQWEE